MNAHIGACVWIAVMVTRLIRGLLVASVVALSLAAPEARAWGAVGASVSVSFNTALSPYGEWVTVAHAGRVWRPYRTVVGPDFVPYQTGGHWENSEYGWIFVSDYDFGWATFHYGRWYLDPYYGWVWVPDEVWGPSWVEWRYGGGYVGWAPLAPTFAIGFGYAYYPHYCFVETRYFNEPNWYRYRVPNYRVNEVHAATAVVPPQQVGGSRYYAGPPAGQISRETGRPVRQMEVQRPPPGRVGVTRVESGRERMIQPSSPVQAQPRSQQQSSGARSQYNPSQRSNQQQAGTDEGGWKQFPSSGRTQSIQSHPQQMPQPWRQGEERPGTGGQVQPYQAPQQRQLGERQQPQQQFQHHEQLSPPQYDQQARGQPYGMPQREMQSQPYQAPQRQMQSQPFGAPQRQMQSQPYQPPQQQMQPPRQFGGPQQREFGSPYGQRQPMQMQAPQYHQTQPMQSAPQYRQVPTQRMQAPQMQHVPMQQPGMRGGAPVHHR